MYSFATTLAMRSLLPPSMLPETSMISMVVSWLATPPMPWTEVMAMVLLFSLSTR